MGPFKIFYDSLLSKNDLGALPVNDLKEILHLNSPQRGELASPISPRLGIKVC